jgi:hypothetical protein
LFAIGSSWAGDAVWGCDQSRDVSTQEEVEADAEPRVPDWRERGATCMVEEEVPGYVGRPAQRQESGPAPKAENGNSTIEQGADDLDPEMVRWSPALQAQQNVGDGGEAEAHGVYQHLAAWSEPPGEKHQCNRSDDSNEDGDFEMGEGCEQGAWTSKERLVYVTDSWPA